MKRWFMIGVIGVTCAAGCKKKEATTGGGGSAGAVSGMPKEIAAWMPKGAAEAWQGAWNSRLTLYQGGGGTMSLAGNPAAIEIKGDKATVWDGKAEHQLEFAVDSPCTVAFKYEITEGGMKGGIATVRKDYVLGADGKLVVGDGAVGYRKGKAAVACTVDGVHTLDDKGTCLVWKDRFGKLESAPATCTWSSDGGKDLLTIGTGDWSSKLYAEGDVLQSEQFARYVEEGYHARAKDYAEAKAAVTAKVKEKDPVEIAKKEGGKVGETSTVASLNATFGSDRASVEGKEVEVTTLFMNNTTSTSNTGTTHISTLKDSKDSKLSLSCYTKDAVSLTQWDKVVAKGKVKESFGEAGLEDCTVTKAP
jgi:hypothetical protein